MQARILATLDDVSSHDFCHSQASALAGSGVDLQTIGKLLRRVNGESTANYTHLAAGRLIAAARPEALTRLELQSALRQAIEQRAFELHYQPIVQLNECNIVGFEALLRWPQPNGDDMAPDIFIPVAEECGLIVPLGTWVLCEACRTAARWSIETGGDRTFSSV